MNAILLLDVRADIAALVQEHVGDRHRIERETDARLGLNRIKKQPLDYDAVVIGDAISDPVGILQDLAAVRKDLASIVLCPPDGVTELQRSMQFTPFLPTDLSIFHSAPPDAAASAIGEAADQLARRRRYERILRASRGDAVSFDDDRHGRVFLDALLEEQRHPVILFDASLKTIRWNEAATDFFGDRQALERRAVKELIGEEAAWALRRDPTAATLISISTRSGAQVASASLRSLQVEGEPVGHILSIHPLEVSEEDPDQGERLELANRALVSQTSTLKQMNEALLRSNRELEDFAYTASHDLQEPLRKINSFSDLLRADFGDILGGDGAFYLDRLQDASNRMIELIRGLLEYSRVTTQAAPLRKTDLSVIVRRVLSDLEVALEESGAEIVLDELPAIEADPIQMRQLFQNLIGNAIKFRRPGVPPLIRIENPTDEDDMVEITVSDNGIGMEMRFAERVFMPFQRLHGRSRYEGSGMGLAICKRIAQRHGGDISVESILGKGSEFRIRLSRQEEAQAAVDNG